MKKKNFKSKLMISSVIVLIFGLLLLVGASMFSITSLSTSWNGNDFSIEQSFTSINGTCGIVKNEMINNDTLSFTTISNSLDCDSLLDSSQIITLELDVKKYSSIILDADFVGKVSGNVGGYSRNRIYLRDINNDFLDIRNVELRSNNNVNETIDSKENLLFVKNDSKYYIDNIAFLNSSAKFVFELVTSTNSSNATAESNIVFNQIITTLIPIVIQNTTANITNTTPIVIPVIIPSNLDNVTIKSECDKYGGVWVMLGNNSVCQCNVRLSTKTFSPPIILRNGSALSTLKYRTHYYNSTYCNAMNNVTLCTLTGGSFNENQCLCEGATDTNDEEFSSFIEGVGCIYNIGSPESGVKNGVRILGFSLSGLGILGLISVPLIFRKKGRG